MSAETDRTGEDPGEVEPNCRMRTNIGESNEWIVVTVTERMLAWSDPCGHCFDGDVGVGDRVVRKKVRKQSRGSLHRLPEDA